MDTFDNFDGLGGGVFGADSFDKYEGGAFISWKFLQFPQFLGIVFCVPIWMVLTVFDCFDSFEIGFSGCLDSLDRFDCFKSF